MHKYQLLGRTTPESRNCMSEQWRGKLKQKIRCFFNRHEYGEPLKLSTDTWSHGMQFATAIECKHCPHWKITAIGGDAWRFSDCLDKRGQERARKDTP